MSDHHYGEEFFFPGIYLGFIMVDYSCLLPFIFTTMHLVKNLASSIFSTPSHWVVVESS